MKSNLVWLSSPIHTNFVRRYLKTAEYNWEDREDIVKNLSITVDGSIIAVKREAIAPYLDEGLVVKLKMGYEKYPNDNFINNDDDFYKFLALNVDYGDQDSEEDEDEDE
jgi:hypothetical protein